MQHNSTVQKIIRTGKAASREQAATAAKPSGKQWKRDDKRGRFSQN